MDPRVPSYKGPACKFHFIRDRNRPYLSSLIQCTCMFPCLVYSSNWCKITDLCVFIIFRECIRGIGEDLLIQAYNIIDTHQEDFVEVC